MKTVYASAATQSGTYEVTFINARGERLTNKYSSPYQARKFINKLRHSRKCILISYPISCM